MQDQAQLFNRPFDSLEEFVDTISECLQCPVTLEDANHYLLAYSSHDDQTDAARIATIIGRRVPEKVINRFWKEGVIPALNQSNEPVIISEMTEIGLGRRVAVSIRKNEEVLGYIWVSESGRTLSKDELELLKTAASKAKNELLQLNMQRKRKERNYQNVLWQLMTGDVHDYTEMKQDLQAIGMHPKMGFSVMIMRFPKLSETLYRQITYAAKTSQKITLFITAQDGDQIIFLTGLPAKDKGSQQALTAFSSTLQAQIAERFSIIPAALGWGSVYDSYDSIKKSYEEAQKVIQLKQAFPKETEDLLFFHELGVLRYVEFFQRHKATASVGKHPALAILQHYDKRHRTELFATLKAFLLTDGNMNEAASLLHVHVNTLNYRLKRIKELTEIDLKNPIQKLGLYFDLLLD